MGDVLFIVGFMASPCNAMQYIALHCLAGTI